MAVPFPGTVAVATCIGCGARSRGGDCSDGCQDVPLDLVDVAAIDRLSRRVRALKGRVRALREVVLVVASGTDPLTAAVRAQATDALSAPLPPTDDDVDAEIVLGWGCPVCGRIDAPQPCLGVCVRKPVEMTDAAAYRELVTELGSLSSKEHELAGLAMFLAHGTVRPGAEARTRAALQARASAILAP